MLTSLSVFNLKAMRWRRRRWLVVALLLLMVVIMALIGMIRHVVMPVMMMMSSLLLLLLLQQNLLRRKSILSRRPEHTANTRDNCMENACSRLALIFGQTFTACHLCGGDSSADNLVVAIYQTLTLCLNVWPQTSTLTRGRTGPLYLGLPPPPKNEEEGQGGSSRGWGSSPLHTSYGFRRALQAPPTGSGTEPLSKYDFC